MLGRSQQLEDVYIIEKPHKFDPSHIRMSPEAFKETMRIHKEFEAIKAEKAIFFKEHFTICFLNVNRLKPHLQHIMNDQAIENADVFAFGETWMQPEDTLNLREFESIQVNLGNGKGIAAIIKNSILSLFRDSDISCLTDTSKQFSAILIRTSNVDLIFLYLSQGFEWKELQSLLNHWISEEKCVAILGDMNIDFLTSNHKFLKYMSRKGFKQLIEKPTHERGNLIDHIYVNRNLLDKGPIHSQRGVYFSDHDIITLHIPKYKC